MIKVLDFPIVVLAAALAASLLAGGLGLMVTCLLGFVWKSGLFSTAWHGARTVMLREAIRKLQ